MTGVPDCDGPRGLRVLARRSSGEWKLSDGGGPKGLRAFETAGGCLRTEADLSAADGGKGIMLHHGWNRKRLSGLLDGAWPQGCY